MEEIIAGATVGSVPDGAHAGEDAGDGGAPAEVEPRGGEGEVGLWVGEAAGAEGSLEDCESERERVRVLEGVGEEAIERGFEARSGPERDEGLEDLVDGLCFERLREGGEEGEGIRVRVCVGEEEIGDLVVSFGLDCGFNGFF